MRLGLALALFLVVACAPEPNSGLFAADSEAERAKICKKAEARYQELFTLRIRLTPCWKLIDVHLTCVCV